MVIKSKNNSGQAVLVVLLSLSVVLVIVLYIMSRTVTDISLSSKEEDSYRAFSAAEAGIERALITGSSTGSIQIDNATFNAQVSGFAAGSDEVIYPISLKSGEHAIFWLNRSDDPVHFAGSQIKYCWGDSGVSDSSSETPALEVTIYYTSTPNDFTTVKVARATLDPNLSRRTSNMFGVGQNSNCTIGGDTFEFQATLNLNSLGISPISSGVLQYTTAKIIYNTTTAHKVGIDVSGYGTLPSQGSKIVSDGTFGDSNRRVEVYQLHPEVPPVFTNAIFSSSGIVHE